MFLNFFAFIFAALQFVQVPQWDNDWKKCSVFVPDTACHWYVVNPDNTFGKGFSWKYMRTNSLLQQKLPSRKLEVALLKSLNSQYHEEAD